MLAVSKGGVEDADVVGIGDVAGDVGRTGFAFVEFLDGGIGGVDGRGGGGGGESGGGESSFGAGGD